MKEAIVGGLLAGLVGGSIVAGAIVVTQGGAVEVYGSVEVMNGSPLLVKIDEPAFFQAPDGSRDNPYYVEQMNALYVKPCDPLAPSGYRFRAATECQTRLAQLAGGHAVPREGPEAGAVVSLSGVA